MKSYRLWMVIDEKIGGGAGRRRMIFNIQNRYGHAERISRSPERSEGEAFRRPSREILRFAQDDMADLGW